MRKAIVGSILVLAIVTMAGGWLFKDQCFLVLQKIKYGTPRSICINNIRIDVEPQWIIDLVYRGGSMPPLLFGVFQIPVKFTELKDDSPQILLRSVKSGAALSIHPARIGRSKEELIANCKANPFCTIEKSKFGGGGEVMLVKAGTTIWMTLLNRNVMVGLSGMTSEEIEGVQISACSKSGA